MSVDMGPDSFGRLLYPGRDRKGDALRLDEVEVARGTLTGLPDSASELYIGVGGTHSSDTFWSGLIDKVRVYNRVIKP